jgi:hypothetical protein
VYVDGSVQDVTGLVTWTSFDTSVATISSAGLITALAPGLTTIRAAAGGAVGSSLVAAQTSPAPSAPAATYYCYDRAGNLTAKLDCPTGQDCSTQCP